MIPRLFQPAQPPAGLNVRELVARYLNHCVAENVHGPAAREERERTLGWFVADCGDLLVSECKPFHLTDWIEAHPAWKSVSTRRQKSNCVRAAFNWAAQGERIDRNPFRSVQYAEAERRPDLPDQTLSQIEQLANKPYETALRFLRLTGCRLGELCNCTWHQLDLERGIWIIPKHKSRKRTGKAKVIALVGEAVVLLRELPAFAARNNALPIEGFVAERGMATPANLIVFLNNRGKPWTRRTLGQQLRRMKKRHGIQTDASLHGIRHRFGSAAVAAGAPIKLVSAQLGHSTVAVTERYYVDLTNEIDAVRSAAEMARPK
jgi:integrase